ncbi:MAG: hypothetical protein HFH72_15325 [Lachnospiraceae bacterium]|nr:hypothetical protein [Lachnospiraceae bacterium]
MENVITNGNSLKERLQLLAGQMDKQNPGYKVLDALLSSESFNSEIGDYFYKSDILDVVTGENINFFMQLVAGNADVKWFWMIEESYHGNGLAFDKYCDVFKKYYDMGITADMAYEKYQNCSSVSEMDAGLPAFKKEAAEDRDKEAGRMPSGQRQEEEAGTEGVTYASDISPQQFQKILEEINEAIKDFGPDSSFIAGLQEQNRAMAQCVSEMRLAMKDLYAEVIQYKKESIDIKMKSELKKHILQDAELRFKIEEKKNSQLKEKYLEAEEKNKKLSAQLEALKKQQEKDRIDRKKLMDAQKDRKEVPAVPAVPKPDEQPNAGKMYAANTEINDEGAFCGRGITGHSGGSMIPIVNGIESIREKSSIFARLFSRHHEKAFMKKSLSEQEGSIFVKMMELKFDKDKVSLVKRMIHGDAKISAVELYKLVSKNPSIEELNLYCNSATVI